MTQDYYISGLQRSGTNLLQQTIETNFQVASTNRIKTGGRTWKHNISMPSEFPSDNLLVIYKNPYTWIESIAFRRPADIVETQRMFPIDEIGGINHSMVVGEGDFNLINICKTWQHYMQNWVVDNQRKTFFVKYESLLQDTQRHSVYTEIENFFGWERVQPELQYLEPGKVQYSENYKQSIEEYYIKGFPKHLTSEQIRTVNNIVGTSLIQQLGYDIIQ